MKSIEVQIAELTQMLPLFIGTLLDGYEPNLPIKLNPSEEKTLMFLFKHEGEPMTEYSKKVSISKGSFTSVADSLEKNRLIERVPVSYDRRKYALILTQEGKNIAEQIIAGHDKQIAKNVSHLSIEQLNNLKNALETLVDTIDILKERDLTSIWKKMTDFQMENRTKCPPKE